MEQEEGCLFCNVQKEESDERVGILHRGRHWFVIINLFPYTNGHIMVVANRHIERLSEISGEEGDELIGLLQTAEHAVDRAYAPDAMNIGVNRGASAGAGVVGHLHFHIVPRWNGDTNFMTAVADARVVSEEIAESYGKMKRYFPEK